MANIRTGPQLRAVKQARGLSLSGCELDEVLMTPYGSAGRRSPTVRANDPPAWSGPEFPRMVGWLPCAFGSRHRWPLRAGRINPIAPAEHKVEAVNRAKAFGLAAFHLDRMFDHLQAGIRELSDRHLSTVLSWRTVGALLPRAVSSTCSRALRPG
jgi:hypothetical protein